MKNSKVECILFILILVVGVFLRLWKLDSLPNGLSGDPAITASNALHIFDKDTFKYFQNNALIGKPVAYLFWSMPLGSFLIAMCLKIFGTTQFAVLFSSAIIGILTIIIVYFLTKKLSNIPVALLSTFFFTVSPWHLLFSRGGFPHITIVVLLICSSLIVLLETIERKRTHLLLWQGVIWGVILFNSYPMAFIAFPITVFYLFWIGKGKWLYSWHFFLSLLIMISTYILLSTVFALLNHSNDIFIVLKESFYQWFIVRLNETQQGTSLRENLLRGLTMLFWKMPQSYHFGIFRIFNYPLLNPVIGVVFVTGLIQSIVRRNGFDKLLIVWSGLAFFSSSTISAPQERYLISILPVPYILSSEFIISLFRTRQIVKFPNRNQIFTVVATILLFAYVYFFSYKPYFVSYAGNDANLAGGLAEKDVADFLLSNFEPESTMVFTSIELLSFNLYTDYRYKKQYIWREFLNNYVSSPANIALNVKITENTPYDGRLAEDVNDGNLGSYWYGDVPDGFEMHWDRPQEISDLIIVFNSQEEGRSNLEYGIEAFDDRAQKWLSVKREIHSEVDAGIALNNLRLKTSRLRFTFYQTNAADLIQRVEEVIVVKAGENDLREKFISESASVENVVLILALNPNFNYYGNDNIYAEIMDRQVNFFFKDLKFESRKVINNSSGKPVFKIYSLRTENI